ncbi:MAG: hypothetical protein CMM90_08425 [Rickettsiales bacterium]|nr:hypothetical protein [Rickettsiales bacterium]
MDKCFYIYRDILTDFEEKTLIQTMKVNVISGFRPNATDSKSVELRFISVRVGLGAQLFKSF